MPSIGLGSTSRVRERPRERKGKLGFFSVDVRFPLLVGRGVEMPKWY